MLKTVSVLLFALAILSSQYQQAEAIYCYGCNSNMVACADPVNLAVLQYQTEPCRSSCYVYTSGGITYRGCSDYIPCLTGATTAGSVSCGAVTYNVCNTEKCNTYSGAAAPTALPTAVPTAPPTAVPTAPPTAVPTAPPTAVPTAVPTAPPTAVPTTPAPTAPPTAVPTAAPTAPPTAVPTTTAPGCVDAASCVNAKSTDCAAPFVASLCPAFCKKCGTPAPTTTTVITTTTTTVPTTTPTPCVNAASCVNAVPGDCSSALVKRICPVTCGTCSGAGTTTTAVPPPPPTTTAFVPTTTQSIAVPTTTTAKPPTATTAVPTTTAAPTTTTVKPTTTTAAAAPTTTTTAKPVTTTLAPTATPPTTTTTVKPTTTTGGVSTPCVAKTCKNSGTWNQAACKCDCPVVGTSGTLCEILDCTFDSFGSSCAMLSSDYAICSDPVENVYCIKTCNLCATTVPPV